MKESILTRLLLLQMTMEKYIALEKNRGYLKMTCPHGQEFTGSAFCMKIISAIMRHRELHTKIMDFGFL